MQNFKVTSNPASIDDNIVIDKFTLYQNFPNPFCRNSISGKNLTTIKYTLSTEESNKNLAKKIMPYAITNKKLVKLKIFDVLGQEIITLVNELQPPEDYEVEFNISSINKHMPSGVYFII